MRVLIVGQQPVFCEGLTVLARRCREDAEIALKTGATAFVPEDDIGEVDLTLADLADDVTLASPELEGVRRLFAALPGRKVVFSNREQPSLIRAVMEMGADGFVPKRLSFELSVNAVQIVLHGGRYLPDSLLDEEPRGFAEARSPFESSLQGRLTPRQQEVLLQLGKGSSNQEIADTLGISVATVKLHVNAILQALGVRNRTEAAIFALRKGAAPK